MLPEVVQHLLNVKLFSKATTAVKSIPDDCNIALHLLNFCKISFHRAHNKQVKFDYLQRPGDTEFVRIIEFSDNRILLSITKDAEMC